MLMHNGISFIILWNFRPCIVSDLQRYGLIHYYQQVGFEAAVIALQTALHGCYIII